MAEESPPRPYEALGRAVALRRTQLGLKRRVLADRAGLSYPYISEIENGLKQPSGTALTQIAGALEFDASELLSLSETLEQESDARRDGRAVDAAHLAPLSHLGLATTENLVFATRPPGTADPAPDDASLTQLIRSEVRRELDAWATYRLPDLIQQELRRQAPGLFAEAEE